MTKQDIDNRYDSFFGLGLWEKDYKPHITIFAEKCVRDAGNEGKTDWLFCEDGFPELGTPVLIETNSGQIHYAFYGNENEFDVHIPTDNKYYRKCWYKYSSRTVIKWRNIT